MGREELERSSDGLWHHSSAGRHCDVTGGRLDDRAGGSGDAMAAIQVQAFAGVTQTVQQGQSVTLDGSGSTGPVKSYSWEQLTGPTVSLTGTDKAKATFTAPSAATDLTFRLTVTGPGGPSTSEATGACGSSPDAGGPRGP